MKARLVLAAAAAVAAALVSTPAEAGTAACVTSHIDISNLDFNVGTAFDCTTNNLGYCTFVYDPLFFFPNNVAPATVGYVNCLA